MNGQTLLSYFKPVAYAAAAWYAIKESAGGDGAGATAVRVALVSLALNAALQVVPVNVKSTLGVV